MRTGWPDLIETLTNLLNLAEVSGGAVRERGVREDGRAEKDDHAQLSPQAANSTRSIAGTPLVSSL